MTSDHRLDFCDIDVDAHRRSLFFTVHSSVHGVDFCDIDVDALRRSLFFTAHSRATKMKEEKR